jgi:hypothetical protein
MLISHSPSYLNVFSITINPKLTSNRRYWSTLTIQKDPILLTKLLNHYHTSASTSLSHIPDATFQIAAHVLSPSFLSKNANTPLSIPSHPKEGLICKLPPLLLPQLSSRVPAIFHLSTWPELSSNEIVKS